MMTYRNSYPELKIEKERQIITYRGDEKGYKETLQTCKAKYIKDFVGQTDMMTYRSSYPELKKFNLNQKWQGKISTFKINFIVL